MSGKRGRPSKAELQSTALMTKRQQAAAIKEYRQRLLLHPKSNSVIEKLFEVALDDEHRNQAAALKLLADRILPAAGFTVEGKQNNAVQICISGINPDATSSVTINGDEAIDAEWEEYADE